MVQSISNLPSLCFSRFLLLRVTRSKSTMQWKLLITTMRNEILNKRYLWLFSVTFWRFFNSFYLLGFDAPVVNCTSPLGMKSKDVIPNEAITASTFLPFNSPEKARFEGKNGGWKSSHADLNQWIQVDLGNITKVTGIATQGIFDSNQWVTKYSLSYRLNEDPYVSYKNDQVRVMSAFWILAYSHQYQAKSWRFSTPYRKSSHTDPSAHFNFGFRQEALFREVFARGGAYLIFPDIGPDGHQSKLGIYIQSCLNFVIGTHLARVM